jgi:hypothetical protein
VRLNRPVLEVSRLVHATSQGFVLRGSGKAVVRTPSAYRPGQVLHAVVRDVTGTHGSTVIVGDDGRATVSVDLGAANAFQQYTVPATLTGTAVREARVTLH